MSRVVRRALSVAVIVALAGCNGDASGPDQPELTGTLLYTGQTDSNDRIRGFLNISASRIQLELRRVE